MTPTLLITALQTFLQEALAEYFSGTPQVHLYKVPAQTMETQDQAEHPFVVIQAAEGADNDENSHVTVHLIVGTKSDDDVAFIDALNLLERIRILLLRQRVIDKRYKMVLPYKWKLYPEDQQAHPEYIGVASTVWELPTVKQEVHCDDFDA